MDRKRGITLVEVLCVIAIVSLLVALLQPLMSKVHEKSTITKSVAQMRQLHQASILYSDDYGHDPRLIVGVASNLVDIKRVYKLPNALFHTGGRPVYDDDPNSDVYVYAPPNAGDDVSSFARWQDHISGTSGNPILLIDITHDMLADSTSVFFRLKRGIGVYYDGHATERTGRSSVAGYEFWE
ncbi:MAG: type II secretion system protein [Fimbriimonadaceae bacterium]|nr:type II secretion system protein [Fimbriimonadaceae bacterium]